MEWTTEKRYLPYNKWDAESLIDLQAQANRSKYQLHYHIRPSSGLLNEPMTQMDFPTSMVFGTCFTSNFPLDQFTA